MGRPDRARHLRHRLRATRTYGRGEDRPQPYAEATRLLTQLRRVARQLPGATLDPGGISEHLLEELRTVARADRAAVLSASGGGRLVVLAQTGVDRVDWETTLDADSAIADAWASQQPQTAPRSQARSHPGGEVSALVVPLVAGVRTVGLVTLEADQAHAYPPPVVAQVTELTSPAALRLEAALLFDEVRSLATNEERQRLAREIHDGVAQELVMVGYGIDNALATLPEGAERDRRGAATLRGEVTRVITELRLSLFELRSEVDRHGGLAAAIAEYARTVGASGGLRVHLSLDESTARLPAATEAELLRIAQEAITNARKHAGAANLWVTCAVDPPYAQIEVSDDGHGIADQRPDGRYGLAIMAERAERIRGRLEIRPRRPSGTTVAVVLGTSPRRDSVRGSDTAGRRGVYPRMRPVPAPATRTKVLLVDDHDLIRKGLRHAFERDRQFEVVGEAATAAEAVRQAGALQPDVVIMDLRLPDGSGLEATRALRKSSATMGIVVLTMYAGDDQLFGALEAGASAFVPKTAPADEVVAAARHAASSPSAFTAADLAEAMKRRLTPSGPQLSPREGQVLRLLADGMSVAGIAKQLFVSESTAKTHISKLYEKLGAANRAQALMTALRLGLLEAPDAPKF